MHQQDLKAAAQSLRFAMELGATGAVFQQKVQQVVLQLGGSVDVSYKLKSNTPDEATRGRLTSLIKRDIVITIAPPEADPQQRIDDDKAPKAPAKAKAAAKDATDTFAEQHAGATH